MAITIAKPGSRRAEINVTPLVDVVLVLLIIFLVATPLLQLGQRVLVPPAAKEDPIITDQLVVRLDGDGSIFINSERVAERDFSQRLRAVLDRAEPRVTFLAADGELPYERVLAFFELCKSNGVANPGIVVQELAPT